MSFCNDCDRKIFCAQSFCIWDFAQDHFELTFPQHQQLAREQRTAHTSDIAVTSFEKMEESNQNKKEKENAHIIDLIMMCHQLKFDCKMQQRKVQFQKEMEFIKSQFGVQSPQQE